jgi:hypothetical protein
MMFYAARGFLGTLAAIERSEICMKVNSSSTTRLYDTTPILTMFNALGKLFGLQPCNEQSRHPPESLLVCRFQLDM